MDAFRWPLIVALVASWLVLLFAQDCRETPLYPEVVLATATICITFWANHVRSDPTTGLRSVGRIIGFAIYDLISLAGLVFVLAIPLAIVIPHYDCYTPRAKVSEVILAASPIRNEINERFTHNRTLRDVGVGLQVTPSKRVAGGFVTTDGIIVLMSEDPPAVVVIQPQSVEGQITWKCRGSPLKIMPTLCRE